MVDLQSEHMIRMAGELEQDAGGVRQRFDGDMRFSGLSGEVALASASIVRPGHGLGGGVGGMLYPFVMLSLELVRMRHRSFGTGSIRCLLT